MSEPFRYALIGCGRIAPNHIAAAMNNADSLLIAAVCDVIPERMEAVLRPVPEEQRVNIRRYTDYRQMLADIKPAIVAVATESGEHAKIGLDCLGAGANVIIEKPIALSLADTRALIAAAEKTWRKTLRMPSEPLQQIHPENPHGGGRRPFRPNAARRGAYPLESRAGVL